MKSIDSLLWEIGFQRDWLRRSCVRDALLPAIWDRRLRATKHFREWVRVPLNYVRHFELPLTLALLDTTPADSVLDVSSPKLLAFYLASEGWSNLTIADIDDYFVGDFEAFATRFKHPPSLRVFDARSIPLADASFDRVFSVSAIEHIPGDGDTQAIREIARVLRPGGIAVVTLPAHSHYLEEWKTSTSYWDAHSVRNERGEVFYQRRYNREAIDARLGNCGLKITDAVYIAEWPIAEPTLGADGRLRHNAAFVQERVNRWPRLLRRRVPLFEYWLTGRASKRLHYLTRDASDPRARQVALKLWKG